MTITKMRAARYCCRENNRVPGLNLCEVTKPAIQRSDEVLIRILNVAICGTDVNALKNPPAYNFKEGVIIGHECCGIVESIGSEVTNCKVGDKVVVHPNIWCGKCESCRTGHINLCKNFRHIGDLVDGAMADYLCIEERMVYTIDSQVPASVASLTEPLACVLNATTTFRAHPGDEVLVIGAGAIGLIFAMLYKAMGAHVIVSDPLEPRRHFALQVGVDIVIDPVHQDLDVEIRKYAPTGVDIVADAVGTQIDAAVQVAKKGGFIALFGLNTIAKPPVNQSDIVMKELHVSGTYITKGTFPRAIKIIENKLIPIEKLITRIITMEEIMGAIEELRSGQVSKIVVEVNKE